MIISTAIKGRESAEVLLIDFEHGYMDVKDPVDGVCRVPLDKTYNAMPTTKDLAVCVEAKLKEIVKREI
jgi:hypothetical protein